MCDVGRVAVKHCFKLLSFFYIHQTSKRTTKTDSATKHRLHRCHTKTIRSYVRCFKSKALNKPVLEQHSEILYTSEDLDVEHHKRTTKSDSTSMLDETVRSRVGLHERSRSRRTNQSQNSAATFVVTRRRSFSTLSITSSCKAKTSHNAI